MEFINDTDYFDQHFLIDKAVLNDFIDACELSIEDEIVEIGPGKGTITELLAKKGKHVTCIELDLNLEHFINVLKDKYKNIDVLYGNALNLYIPSCDKIISALPYSITEPFIEKLLRCEFKESILIVGKRFADNVCNKSLTKLSLLTNSFFNVEKIRDIEPNCFDPAPRVMSSIIKLKPKQTVKTSVIGNASHTPTSPKPNDNTKTAGIIKINPLNNETICAGTALSTEAK